MVVRLLLLPIYPSMETEVSKVIGTEVVVDGDYYYH